MPLPRLLRTSTFRLTLLGTAIFAFAVLLLFGVVTWSATRFMSGQIDATVANELAEIQADATAPGSPGMQRIVAALALRSPGIAYLLQGPKGRSLAGNMLPIRPLPGLRTLHASRRPGSAHVAGGIRGRGVLLADGRYLFVGLSTFELGEMQEVIARAFAVGIGLTLALALAGGLATSLGLLRRIEAITLTSREIMSGDLDRRIRLTGRDDEFDRLAASLNAMLDRIQALMAGLQQVSSDIAHDLRTPLTRLRQGLELARRRERDTAGLAEAVDRAIAQTDAILATFSALLRIAQIEARTRRAGFATVQLDAVLATMEEAYRPSFEERGQRLIARIAPSLALAGDAELLGQLVANLLENALVHAPPGATVVLAACRDAEGVRLCVADDGPGVPEVQRSLVLRRFYRLESSRTTPGNGLGLSLVAAVAALHDATLSLEDNAPGLRCVVRFATRPAAAPPAPSPALPAAKRHPAAGLPGRSGGLRRLLLSPLYRLYEGALAARLADGPMPAHLALILDGNRRQARREGGSDYGPIYRRSAEKLDDVLAWCRGLGIAKLTLWLCSTDNLGRAPEEVSAVLDAIEAKMRRIAAEQRFGHAGIRLEIMGRLDLLPESLVETLTALRAQTAAHDRMTLTLAIGYGGREEIVDAVRACLRDLGRAGMAAEAMAGAISVETIGRYLYVPHLPDPDLIIRTSGEVRLSGFMTWQSARSEFYFCDVNWPAFRRLDLLRAIRAYQGRKRRYGR